MEEQEEGNEKMENQTGEAEDYKDQSAGYGQQANPQFIFSTEKHYQQQQPSQNIFNVNYGEH